MIVSFYKCKVKTHVLRDSGTTGHTLKSRMYLLMKIILTVKTTFYPEVVRVGEACDNPSVKLKYRG